jgi:hypothetical protein
MVSKGPANGNRESMKPTFPNLEVLPETADWAGGSEGDSSEVLGRVKSFSSSFMLLSPSNQ